jgi:hypothetical protein
MDASSILFSYIDPVSGVILLQLIVGGTLGFVIHFQRKIRRFFGGFFLRRKAAEGTEIVSSAVPRLEETEPSLGIVSFEEGIASQNRRESLEDCKAA